MFLLQPQVPIFAATDTYLGFAAFNFFYPSECQNDEIGQYLPAAEQQTFISFAHPFPFWAPSLILTPIKTFYAHDDRDIRELWYYTVVLQWALHFNTWLLPKRKNELEVAFFLFISKLD